MMNFRETAKTVLAVMAVVLALAAVASGGSRFEAIATGSMAGGDVLLELTPSVEDSGRLVVKFAANTHTEDLSKYDLKSLATLEAGGQIIRPSDSDRLKGHHAFGKMIFDVPPAMGAFKIKVVGIPAVSERVYEWE